jgi:hypothetical protein
MNNKYTNENKIKMSFSKIGKDFTIKMLITVKNPTKPQLVHLTNVLYTCKDNQTNNNIIINDLYNSNDCLQNIRAVNLLSIYDMSDTILETIKKPFPYKLPPQ